MEHPFHIKPYIIPNNIVTVIIRNDSPLRHCNDTPQYRTVQLKLTDEQKYQLRLMWTDRVGKTNYFESISNMFIEPELSELE